MQIPVFSPPASSPTQTPVSSTYALGHTPYSGPQAAQRVLYPTSLGLYGVPPVSQSSIALSASGGNLGYQPTLDSGHASSTVTTYTAPSSGHLRQSLDRGIPLPLQSGARLAIHKCLALDRRGYVTIALDVTQPDLRVLHRYVDEPATQPQTPSLSICVGRSSNTFVIHHGHSMFVTVGDVVQQMCWALQSFDLNGRHRFMGLSAVASAEDVFELYLA